jgi:hypothetical protein
MEDSLKCFHDNKTVFTIYRVGKKGMKAATALRSQLIGQRNQAIVEAATDNAKHRVRNSWNRKINTRIQELLVQHGHFNFPKIHLLGHFRRSIEQFGALEQHSNSTTEISHKSQIKQGFLHSNRTGDYYREILHQQKWILNWEFPAPVAKIIGIPLITTRCNKHSYLE